MKGMDCGRVNDLLVDYLYQELDSGETGRFEAHVDVCSKCSRLLADFQATRDAVRSLPDLEPPALVSQRLISSAAAALESSRTTLWERILGSFRFVVMHPAMTAAVTIVVVIGISFYAYRRSPPTPKLERPPFPLEVVRPTGEAGSSRRPSPARSIGRRHARADEDGRREGALTTLKDQEDATASIAAGDLKSAQEKNGRTKRKVRRARSRGPSRTRVARRPARRDKRRSNRAFPQAKFASDEPAAQAVPQASATPEPNKPRPDRALSNEATPKAKPRRKRPGIDDLRARGDAAAANRRCFEALGHYDRVLAARPDLAKKLYPSIQRCIHILGHEREDLLNKAKKSFPRLAGYLQAELKRVRKTKRAKAKKPVKPPPQSSAFE